MTLAVKQGVKLPTALAMSIIVDVVHSTMRDAGFDCTITGALEGSHSRSSKHYVGLALDFRSRNIPPGEQPKLRDKIAALLGPDFDVILEPDHFHIEYDVKTPIGA